MVAESKECKIGIIPKCCPICNVSTNNVYCIEEFDTGHKAQWYNCQCGVIFQDRQPKHECYDAKYLAFYEDAKDGYKHNIHAARTYAPIIEELTYGRMMLDVGFAIPASMKYFEDRGWLTWGIDINKEIKGKGHIYKGDFQTYDFSPKIDQAILDKLVGVNKKEIKREFDLIWMSHVFEHFSDPIAALKKAYNLLSFSGVLYISTPDIDAINKEGIVGFPHWKSREHYILWSERALKRELERLRFKIIMSRRNFSARYISWFDIHIIAQKDYF